MTTERQSTEAPKEHHHRGSVFGSISMPKRPSVSNVETFTQPATHTSDAERAEYVALREETEGMNDEQAKEYLAKRKAEEERLSSERSSGHGVGMAGADWVYSVGGAASESANPGEYDGKK